MAETWGEPAEVEARLHRYMAAVRSSPHNLLSPRGLEELPTRHIPECLALAHRLPPGPATVLDVGSGGGLPGLVVALARPDLRVTLLEATTKKADFLEATSAALEVDVAVLNGRAEELTDRYGGRYDIVTARAVAPLPRLLDWTLPFLRPGGALYAVKGERWAEELREATGDLARFGARVLSLPEPARPEDPTDPRVVIIGVPA